MIDITLIISAYLIGSISAAIIVCRIMGLPDPRSGGSNNPGATNVLRLGGKVAALLTLLGDTAKGLLPVAVAVQLSVSDTTLALTMVAAFLGHIYPLFFGFKGGKGVATALGVLFGLHWSIGLATIITWLAVAAIFRYSSLAALSAILLAPAYVWLLMDNNPQLLTFAMGLITVILYLRHSSNIKKLLAGEESKIGSRD